MNKKLLIALLSGCSFAATAQSTLTNVNPQPGDNHVLYSAPYQAVGNSGSNITWDFSSLTSTSSSPVQYATCTNNAICNNFPGSTIVGTQSSASSSLFFAADNTKQSMNGTLAGSVSIIYSDAEDFLRYPFTYNTNYTDAFRASFVNGGTTFYRSGSVTVKGDAYGTLKLPSGIFTNVIRVHRTETYHDSAVISGIPIFIPYVDEMYTWYSPNVREALLSISNLTSNGTAVVQSTVYTNIVPAGIVGVSTVESSLQLFPNPAKEQVNLKFNIQRTEDLRISIVDLVGKEVGLIANGTYQAGTQEFTYNTSNFAAGMYIVRIQSGETTIARKIQIQ